MTNNTKHTNLVARIIPTANGFVVQTPARRFVMQIETRAEGGMRGLAEAVQRVARRATSYGLGGSTDLPFSLRRSRRMDQHEQRHRPSHRRHEQRSRAHERDQEQSQMTYEIVIHTGSGVTTLYKDVRSEAVDCAYRALRDSSSPNVEVSVFDSLDPNTYAAPVLHLIRLAA